MSRYFWLNLKRRKLVKGRIFSVRFSKQTDHFRCAPLALLNTLKLKGWPVTAKKHLKALSTLCGTENWGTDLCGFRRALKSLRKYLGEYRIHSFPKASFIRNELDKGNIILFTFQYPMAADDPLRDVVEIGKHTGHFRQHMMLLVKCAGIRAGSGKIGKPEYLGVNINAGDAPYGLTMSDLRSKLRKRCKCKDRKCGPEIIIIQGGLAC